MSEKKVTIRTVAKRAGVSVATVSYVINNGPRTVAAETKKKIQQVMDDLGYQPNIAARILANKKTNTIGLIFSGLSDQNLSLSNYFEYVRGISAEVEAEGYNLLLFGNHKQARQKQFYDPIVKSHMVDGLILLGSSIPDDEIVDLNNKKFPSLLLGRRIIGREIYSVQQDYRQGAYDAVVHLIEQGYRRIGFLGQNLKFSYAQERLDGYRCALEDKGTAVDKDLISIPSDLRDEPSVEDINFLLHLRDPADVLVTDKEIQVFTALRNLGLTVPDDIALIGLDENENGMYLDMPISSVRTSKFDLGKKAVEKLKKIIEGVEEVEKVTVQPMSLVIKGSSPPYRSQSG